ncbi:uncharacterized protein LOC143183667 isoform X2 [Calliopsis andreniformis]|uniref:uncharacterized protein LOC143183667 isoform X2 n=1 Tax=Calliopsis andreniformis TaxID=337506 RepID=UPI003FCEC630
MWMTLAGGLQAFASASAEETVNVAEEDVSDATIPPDAIPSFDGNLPTPQQLLEMIDSMSGISEEEKATLKEDLLKSIQGQGFDGNPVAGNAMTMETLILLSLLGVVALIFVFFVYKLFRCLSEREMKREEKKKNKQLKKKK